MTYPTDAELEAMARIHDALSVACKIWQKSSKNVHENTAAMLRACKGRAVKVKPLEWFVKLHQSDMGTQWATPAAETPFGTLTVNDHRPFKAGTGFSYGFNDYVVDINYPWLSSEEAAKDAAQADYERRILSTVFKEGQ